MEARLESSRIGFIGGGNMAWAIAKGLVLKGVIRKVTAVSGPHPENYKTRWGEFTETITGDNLKVVQNCNVVFICCKPNQLQLVADEITQSLDKFVLPDKVFVTVLAGTSKSKIYESFHLSPQDIRIVRTMPNICVQVGEGCCQIAQNSTAEDPKGDAEFISWLMNRVGTAAIVPEDKFEAYTGLSGSGPAYIFTIIDALADGAVKQGAPRDLAIKFAAQTVCGAAKTQLITGKHPAVLKDEVCSPGGTTIAGIHELEKGGLRAALINAVQASSEKAKAMALEAK